MGPSQTFLDAGNSSPIARAVTLFFQGSHSGGRVASPALLSPSGALGLIAHTPVFERLIERMSGAKKAPPARRKRGKAVATL